ncbi:hypothetical protein J7426_01470 [Tropicibacter sp. R16_0]|uniref:hypothetical protein n=1 Tax=Tropicibacter sp. R16_0 TaxID=2821102 RepID=UPI001ADA493A|nr:hypothetical protein [Tropicibacter sp. R16_0]MBO9448906.1 hypothetical protein [Tropicibacter sp. R16_0]
MTGHFPALLFPSILLSDRGFDVQNSCVNVEIGAHQSTRSILAIFAGIQARVERMLAFNRLIVKEIDPPQINPISTLRLKA